MSEVRPRLDLATAPFMHRGLSTPRLMGEVHLSLIPVIVAAAYFFGITAILVVLAATAGAMAMEWGPHGVRINAIAPGFTMTELARPLWESRDDMNEWRQENTPLRRMGQPEDMIGATIFLASEASSWISGQVLYIDGGTSCGLFWPIDG